METTVEGIVRFVSKTNPNPGPNPPGGGDVNIESVLASLTGSTGDGIMLVVGILLLVLAATLCAMYFAKRNKINLQNLAGQTVQAVTVRSKRIFAVVGIIAFLLGSIFCLVTTTKAVAIAAGAEENKPELSLATNDIVGTVDDQGNVSLAEATLTNLGTEDGAISMTQLRYADDNTLNLSECTWTS